MYLLETIEKVVSHRIRALRGKKTQEQMAALLEMPLVTYQRLENGAIPRSSTRKVICEKLNIRETWLFLDPDLTEPTDQQVIERVQKRLSPSLSAVPNDILQDSVVLKILEAFRKDRALADRVLSHLPAMIDGMDESENSSTSSGD